VSVPDEPRVVVLTSGGTHNLKQTLDIHTLLLNSIQSLNSDTAHAVTSGQTESSVTWILDSGCTTHMCNNRDLFHTFSDNATIRFIQVANGTKIPVTGMGSIIINTVNTNKQMVELMLHTVLCVPALSTNLISATKLQREHEILMLKGGNGAIISLHGNRNSQLQLYEHNGLPILHARRTMMSLTTQTPVWIWRPGTRDLHTQVRE